MNLVLDQAAITRPNLDRAIARADLLRLVKHAHDELVAAKLRLNDAQHALREFDRQAGRAHA